MFFPVTTGAINSVFRCIEFGALTKIGLYPDKIQLEHLL